MSESISPKPATKKKTQKERTRHREKKKRKIEKNEKQTLEIGVIACRSDWALQCLSSATIWLSYKNRSSFSKLSLSISFVFSIASYVYFRVLFSDAPLLVRLTSRESKAQKVYTFTQKENIISSQEYYVYLTLSIFHSITFASRSSWTNFPTKNSSKRTDKLTIVDNILSVKIDCLHFKCILHTKLTHIVLQDLHFSVESTLTLKLP